MNDRSVTETPSLWVYAIAERVADWPETPGPAGVQGAAVTWREASRLGAWVSEAPLEEPGVADLMAHHRVVDAACALSPALPVRFGTTAHDGRLRAVLDGREAALRAALRRVAGQRELALTLVWRDRVAGDAERRVAEPQADGQEPGGGPGTRFLQARRAALHDEMERTARAEHLAHILQALVLPHARPKSSGGTADGSRIKMRIVPSRRIAVSCAVLVEAAAVAGIAGRVRQDAAAWPDVSLHIGGPWPPYSFSELPAEMGQ